MGALVIAVTLLLAAKLSSKGFVLVSLEETELEKDGLQEKYHALLGVDVREMSELHGVVMEHGSEV